MENIGRSYFWFTLCNILDGLYPKGDKGRGKALVFLAYVEMMLKGWQFDKDGMPNYLQNIQIDGIKTKSNRLCLICGKYINKKDWIKHLSICEKEFIKK